MPGAKGKKASKQRSAGSTSKDAFVEKINNSDGWDKLVWMLCEHFELPDLTTRKGLKKVHGEFDNIYRRLDHAYATYHYSEKVKGGIVGIYAKMCLDSILRDKLFNAGFLSRLTPLLDLPLCRYVALRSLMTVTHHGGIEARTEIASHTPKLVKLIQEYPDDSALVECAVVTMSHALGAVVGGGDQPPNKQVTKHLNMQQIFRTVTEAIRRPNASFYLLNHAIELFSTAILHFHKEAKSYPPMLTFLTACLRCKDISLRCNAVGAIFSLYYLESPDVIPLFDPMKISQAVGRGYPRHLNEVLRSYGPERSEVNVMMKTMADYQRAMMQCAQDHNLYSLGLKLANLILRTEFSVMEGGFQGENPRTGALEVIDVGLPFKMWTESLPLCANAIRAKGGASEEDLADILDLKYLIIQRGTRIPEIVAHAKRAISRNPHNAYFYYAVSMGGDVAEGLKMAKKGLKCKNITPFVRSALLQRAVDHAAAMGLRIAQNAPTDAKEWEEGIAFLHSAFEDSKAFAATAPPDTRHMAGIIETCIILSFVIRGPELEDNLESLQDLLNKLKHSHEFIEVMGIQSSKTKTSQTQDTIVSLHPTAIEQWSTVIRRINAESPGDKGSASMPPAEDALATWLEKMETEEGVQESFPDEFHSDITFDTSYVELYRCSWCRNPSAILRKCSGCGKTRYCDSSCQKLHWTDHKAACKKIASSTKVTSP